jgi:hypothetical protein
VHVREVALRAFVRPVWVAGPPRVETWTCPACRREVERVSPAWKGIWFTASDGEVTALCSRTHRTHDRAGQPLAVDDVPLADHQVPIVAVEADPDDRHGPPSAFVALVPPAGRSYVRRGDEYEVRELDELSPSDLVGSRVASLSGRIVDRVAVAEVTFDDLARPAAITGG